MDATMSRSETASDRKITPPNDTSTGTESWTVAARVGVRPRNAAYQITYPIPEAREPDSPANQMPVADQCACESVARLTNAARGTERTKFGGHQSRRAHTPAAQ